MRIQSTLIPRLVLSTLLFVCWQTEAAPSQSDTNDVHASSSALAKLNPAAAPRLGEPINDKALYQYLETEGRKLVDANRTLTDWKKKLGRKSCTLKLPEPESGVLTPAEIGRRMEPAVAVIGTFYLCDKCSKLHMATASGFFLNSSGALATCRHVLASRIANGKGIVVLTRDGKVCPVRDVLAVDPLHDLMVLQVDGQDFSPLPLTASAPPGAPVVVMSHPETHFYLLTTGVVGRQAVQRRSDGLFHSLTITADFAKGSSGAPVCDATGSVVALVDNTESIYYTTEGQQQNNLQMVLKNCAPAAVLMDMVHGGTARKSQ